MVKAPTGQANSFCKKLFFYNGDKEENTLMRQLPNSNALNSKSAQILYVARETAYLCHEAGDEAAKQIQDEQEMCPPRMVLHMVNLHLHACKCTCAGVSGTEPVCSAPATYGDRKQDSWIYWGRQHCVGRQPKCIQAVTKNFQKVTMTNTECIAMDASKPAREPGFFSLYTKAFHGVYGAAYKKCCQTARSTIANNKDKEMKDYDKRTRKCSGRLTCCPDGTPLTLATALTHATNTINSKLTHSTSGGHQSSAGDASASREAVAGVLHRRHSCSRWQVQVGGLKSWQSALCNPAGVAAAAADAAAQSEQERQEQQRKRIATAAQANKRQRAALPGASGAPRGGRGGGRRSGDGRGCGRARAANQSMHDFDDDDADDPIAPLEEAD
eukprot:365704-Chlamydomonas_euryale.AAC.13